jgi:hypothetical protein
MAVRFAVGAWSSAAIHDNTWTAVFDRAINAAIDLYSSDKVISPEKCKSLAIGMIFDAINYLGWSFA